MKSNLKVGRSYKTRSGRRVEVLKVGLTPYNGISVVALLYGYDEHTWTVISYSAMGKYDVTYGEPHGLDIMSPWTSLKAVEDDQE